MIHHLVSATLLLLAAALAAPPALAEQPAQPGGAIVEEGEAILDEEVLDSGVEIEPDQQGMRPPVAVEENGAVDLYALLQGVRRAPPGLDGSPIERPNAWASEPETEMAPQQPRDAFLFPPDYIE